MLALIWDSLTRITLPSLKDSSKARLSDFSHRCNAALMSEEKPHIFLLIIFKESLWKRQVYFWSLVASIISTCQLVQTWKRRLTEVYILELILEFSFYTKLTVLERPTRTSFALRWLLHSKKLYSKGWYLSSRKQSISSMINSLSWLDSKAMSSGQGYFLLWVSNRCRQQHGFLLFLLANFLRMMEYTFDTLLISIPLRQTHRTCPACCLVNHWLMVVMVKVLPMPGTPQMQRLGILVLPMMLRQCNRNNSTFCFSWSLQVSSFLELQLGFSTSALTALENCSLTWGVSDVEGGPGENWETEVESLSPQEERKLESSMLDIE